MTGGKALLDGLLPCSEERACLPTMSATAMGGSLARGSRGVVARHTALFGRMMPSQAAGLGPFGRRHADRAEAGRLHHRRRHIAGNLEVQPSTSSEHMRSGPEVPAGQTRCRLGSVRAHLLQYPYKRLQGTADMKQPLTGPCSNVAHADGSTAATLKLL